MGKRSGFSFLLSFALSGSWVAIAAPAPIANRAQLTASYSKLPLSFEPNQGQTDARVKFLSRGPGYTFWLNSTEAVFGLREPVSKPEGRLKHQKQPRTFRSATLRMKLA